MTDKQKIKHVIAVLNVLDNRIEACPRQKTEGCSIQRNIQDLIKLLEVPHTIEKKEPSRNCTVAEWDMACNLSRRLYNLIKQRKSNYREYDLGEWATVIDRIIRIDKRTVAQVAEVIDWCQQDNFWQNNILSPSKLRKQLDRLELQMSNDFHWQRGKLQRSQHHEGPTAKQKYMENLNENSQGDDG